MSAIGAAATPALYITGNKLEAEEADEENDDFTESAGMSTAKDYIDAVAANEDAVGEVHFDTVETVLDADGDEESSDTADFVVWKSGTAAVVDGAYTATIEKRALLVDLSEASTLRLQVGDVDVFHDGSNYGAVTLSSNKVIAKGELLTSLATTRATDLGFELDVIIGGNYTMPAITFLNTVNSVTNGEYFSNTAAFNLEDKTSYLTTYDEFTLTIGGLSARASVAVAAAGSLADDIADALIAAWAAKYANAGVASGNLSYWTTGNDTGSNAIIEALTLKSSNSGSAAGADTVAITWERATSAQVSEVSNGARTQSVIDWTFADDSNAATGPGDLIVKLTEVTDGVISSNNATFTAGVTTSVHELTTNLTSNASAANTDTTNTVYPLFARADVVKNEAGDEGVVTTAAVAATDRTAWLD